MRQSKILHEHQVQTETSTKVNRPKTAQLSDFDIMMKKQRNITTIFYRHMTTN